ncbi:MOSC domain-containing protein [uncultured Jatrophihabitans sp.]|uniref:MOSC domain-containing protein n=1 Tax=uncultured Jatrophihabitans sp. TaxID=1610747 RepID=UPI0035C9FC0D
MTVPSACDSAPHVLSVNIGVAEPNPYKRTRSTGIGKRPVQRSVEVRRPGPKRGGLGSGLVGDHIGDTRHHGGDEQAVYAFAREDLDRWERRLGRPLANGAFGENLTTVGIDPNDSRIGEVWQIGRSVQLQVTAPRVPCATFRGWIGEPGWLKTFAADARSGAYFRVLNPGQICGGDPIGVLHRPSHDVTVSLAHRALLGEPQLLPMLLAAGEDLPADIAAQANAWTS